MMRYWCVLVVLGCGGESTEVGDVEPLPVTVGSPTGLVLVEWDPSRVIARIDGFLVQRGADLEGPFEDFYYLDRSRRALLDVTYQDGEQVYYRVIGLQGSRPVARSEVSVATSTLIVPFTTIEQAPPAVIDTNAAIFRWSGQSLLESGAVGLFTWRLDDDPWSAPSTENELALQALSVGTHRLQVRSIDERGNQDPTPAEVRFDVDLDHAPSLLVDSGDVATSEVAVALRLRARDVTEMQFGQDESFASASWLPFAALASVTLSAGEGPKTVFARYRTRDGDVTATVSDTIMLDQTPPAATVTFPVDGTAVTADSITIYGQVVDLTPVTLRCGTVEAVDQGGAFALMEVPLEVGENRLVVELEDAVGLRDTVNVSVWRHPSVGECAF